MGIDQNTRAYRRRLNVVANTWRRKTSTETETQTSEPPIAVKLLARSLVWLRGWWKVILFVLWLAIVAAIGVLSQC